MSQKRSRSINWDEEEKQLFRSVLKEYAHIIEDKSLNTNANKLKTKAWEGVHNKFNGLNCRQRELTQLKIQWKSMKVNARKTFSAFKNECTKTGGGARPATPDDCVIEIKDLLNPAELLRDHNPYDSDGLVPNSSANKKEMESTSGKCAIIPMQDSTSIEVSLQNINQEKELLKDLCVLDHISIEEVDAQVDEQKFTASRNLNEDVTAATPLTHTNMGKITARKVLPKRKIIKSISDGTLKSKKGNDYVSDMLSYTKSLKAEEHKRRMEMAEEEHSIKMAIHKEKLKCAILEREILELDIFDRKNKNC